MRHHRQLEPLPCVSVDRMSRDFG